MLKNLINERLQEEDMSINRLSKLLKMDYSSTHGLVTRNDLSDTKLATVVAVAKILDVEVTELYQEIYHIDAHFNKDKIKILIKEGGGDKEYKYNFFKEGFEEWSNELDVQIADVSHLEIYLRECGYNVIEITE